MQERSSEAQEFPQRPSASSVVKPLVKEVLDLERFPPCRSVLSVVKPLVRV